MSFEPPAGILDIGNATLRVGKLEVAETSGLNQGLQNIIKNDLLITENNESSPYTTNQKWGLKLPTTWVGEFEVKGHSGKYIDFNFYNENSASNAQGYNLTFKDTTMTLRYDGGNPLGGGAATIPTIVGAFRKVNIFFERGVISVSIDGTRYLYHKETDGYNQGLGVASRVVSTTGSAFVNLFIESDNENNSAFKNLRIVNGRFISDKTSNIAFIGGNLGVGVNSPKEALDIRGNMHFERVSNVSQIKVSSNVVAEYTGPHDRPLRKYPEVALTANDNSSTSGYVASKSSGSSTYDAWKAFDEDISTYWYSGSNSYYATSDGSATESAPLLDTGTDRGDWLAIEIPNGIKLESFKLTRHDASFPSSGTLYARNSSGDSWTEIYRYNGYTSGNTTQVFNVNSTIVYKIFALVGRAREQGANTTYGIAIKDWELYGYEEGGGSLDTTLKTVYNVPATTGTQLEVYYDGRETSSYPESGVMVTDISPKTNNGTLNGGVGFDTTYKAFTFDGTDDYIEGNLNGITTGQWVHTMSFWFKLTARNSSTFNYIAQIGKRGTNGQGTLVATRFNYLSFGVWGDSRIETNIQPVPGEWYHISAVYSGGVFYDNATLYINGIGYDKNNGSTGSIRDEGDPLTFLTTGNKITLGKQMDVSSDYVNGSIANFRLYSKALNADQIKELYDYQKDYFLGSKSQVTLYKGHLGVGVTEPSGQLELAGDERIQEYPPGPMSGYETLIPGHGVFCASASTEHNTNRLAWMAFNDESGETSGDSSGFWRSEYLNSTDGPYNGSTGAYISNARLGSDTALGEYVVLQLPYKIQLRSLRMSPNYRTVLDDFDIAEFPKNFTIYGSNDGNNWYSVFVSPSQTLTAASGSGATTETTSYTIANNEYYKYFGLVVTETNYGNYSVVGHGTSIGNLQYFGTPGPTTLDKGSLTLGRSLDVPRISRYDVDTETPRPEKLVVDFDTNISPFNNQFIEDKSGRGNDGIPYGSATYSSADKAFKFDGTTDYIKGNLSNTGDTDFTVSLWLKKNTSGTAGLLWNFGGSGGTGNPEDSVALEVGSNNNLNYFIFSGAEGFISNFAVTYLNRWVHIVATRSGNNLNVYLDGVDQNFTTTGSDTLQLAANTEYTIGARGTGSLGTSSLSGYISNFKVYDVVLEPSEVQKLYRLGRTGRSMILADTSLQIGAGLHDSINTTGGPRATLDVHGSILASSTIHGMSGNFHKMLGYARGGGQADHHRADNCLVAMGGMTAAGSASYASAGFIIRKSANWMPFIVECYHCGHNSSDASQMFGRNALLFGAINNTSITPTNGTGSLNGLQNGSANSGIVLSASARGDDTVLFNISANREGRTYGVMMCRLTYYYGIKGRQY